MDAARYSTPGERAQLVPGARLKSWQHRVRRSLPLLGAVALIVGMAFWTPAAPDYAGRPLRHWLGQLTSNEYQQRLEAEATLRGLGIEAIPELVRAVDARDSVLSASWRRVRRSWFGDTAGHRPSAEQLSMAAARLLSRFGTNATPASAALVRLLSEGSPDASREAEPALRAIGPPAAAELVRVLAQGAPAARHRTLDFLRRNGSSFQPNTGPLVSEVLRLGSVPDPTERGMAIEALAALDAEAPQAVPFLVSRLTDEVPDVRLAAVKALAGMGPDADAARTDLTRVMNAGSPGERAQAASALWSICRDASLVLATLTRMLEYEEARTLAANTLAEMGPAAAPAASALLSALAQEQTHRPSRTPSIVALALGRIGPEAVPGLVQLAAHHDADIRINAAFALRSQGTNATPAVPALIEMLQAPDPEERLSAANALAAIGPGAREAHAELARLAATTSGDVIVGHVASAARDALRRLGPSAAEF